MYICLTNLDKQGGNARLKDTAIIEMKSLMDRFNICDSFRELHPMEKKYTFEKFRPSLLRERIDFFLVSNSLRDFIVECDIYKNTVSDHDLISLYIKGHNVPSRGPGIYKFNNELLTNETFVNDMRENIPIWIADAEAQLEDSRDQWDFLKYKMGGFSRKFGAQVKKERDRRKNELMETIEELSKNLNMNNIAEYEVPWHS